jgi:hypothetical protein
MTPSDTTIAAEMRYVDIRRGKPPSSTLYFDVRLRNLHSEPRWFLLPRSLDAWRDIGKSGGVTRADVYEYGASGTGSIRLGDFYGNGGFSALLLPAGAEVTLHRFSIATMQDPAGLQKLSIPLMIARRVEIDGQSAESWFGGNALGDKTADVACDQGNKLYSHNSSNSIELPVTLIDEECLTLEVPIT